MKIILKWTEKIYPKCHKASLSELYYIKFCPVWCKQHFRREGGRVTIG